MSCFWESLPDVALRRISCFSHSIETTNVLRLVCQNFHNALGLPIELLNLEERSCRKRCERQRTVTDVFSLHFEYGTYLWLFRVLGISKEDYDPDKTVVTMATNYFLNTIGLPLCKQSTLGCHMTTEGYVSTQIYKLYVKNFDYFERFVFAHMLIYFVLHEEYVMANELNELISRQDQDILDIFFNTIIMNSLYYCNEGMFDGLKRGEIRAINFFEWFKENTCMFFHHIMCVIENPRCFEHFYDKATDLDIKEYILHGILGQHAKNSYSILESDVRSDVFLDLMIKIYDSGLSVDQCVADSCVTRWCKFPHIDSLEIKKNIIDMMILYIKNAVEINLTWNGVGNVLPYIIKHPELEMQIEEMDLEILFKNYKAQRNYSTSFWRCITSMDELMMFKDRLMFTEHLHPLVIFDCIVLHRVDEIETKFMDDIKNFLSQYSRKEIYESLGKSVRYRSRKEIEYSFILRIMDFNIDSDFELLLPISVRNIEMLKSISKLIGGLLPRKFLGIYTNALKKNWDEFFGVHVLNFIHDNFEGGHEFLRDERKNIIHDAMSTEKRIFYMGRMTSILKYFHFLYGITDIDDDIYQKYINKCGNSESLFISIMRVRYGKKFILDRRF